VSLTERLPTRRKRNPFACEGWRRFILRSVRADEAARAPRHGHRRDAALSSGAPIPPRRFADKLLSQSLPAFDQIDLQKILISRQLDRFLTKAHQLRAGFLIHYKSFRRGSRVRSLPPPPPSLQVSNSAGDPCICPADSGLFPDRPRLCVSLCKAKRRI
jgi:hypothetical protein